MEEYGLVKVFLEMSICVTQSLNFLLVSSVLIYPSIKLLDHRSPQQKFQPKLKTQFQKKVNLQKTLFPKPSESARQANP